MNLHHAHHRPRSEEQPEPYTHSTVLLDSARFRVGLRNGVVGGLVFWAMIAFWIWRIFN